jgi:putative ABC transport system ATP-binding protein
MAIQIPTPPSYKDDVEAAALLFEQISAEAGESVDRSRIRRALEESADATFMGPWWNWLSQTCESLGLISKTVDCTPEQMLQLAYDGARVITQADEDWLSVVATRKNRFLVVRSLADQQRQWMSSRQLKQLIHEAEDDGVIRCVVIEPRLPSGAGAMHMPAVERTPLKRVISLLAPEWSDIWIVIVFAIVTGLLALATPLAVETLVSTVAFGRLLQPVVIIAIMLLAFLSFSAALKALQTYTVEIIQRRMFARIASDLAYRLPRVEYAAFDGKDSRELVNRFFDVVTVQKVSASLLLDGISLVLGALIGMAVLAFYHPWLLGFDVVLLALIAFVILVLGRGAIQTSIKESKSKYYMASWFENLVKCPVTFRYSGAQDFALDHADHLVYEYLSRRKAHFRILLRQIVFALGLQAVASTVLLGLGGWLVITGQLTLGQLVAAELIVTVIVGSFAKLGKHMESYYDLLASVDKLGVLFDLPIERHDGLLDTALRRPAHVVFAKVDYHSKHGHHPLHNFDLKVAPGERVMLTGPSGTGKSLLLDFLYGLRDPSAGHVEIDGMDPRDFRPDALRKRVALVRNPEIFSGTVLENVHLERPDVSVHDVREVLEKVGLLETILELPHGLDTQMIDVEDPLTKNQAIKLVLARAMVGRPCLLLVDGLLDALPDHEAEQLTEILCQPSNPWTLMMVTGRERLADLGTRRQIMYPALPAH